MEIEEKRKKVLEYLMTKSVAFLVTLIDIELTDSDINRMYNNLPE